MTSERPEYNKKIKAAFLLAPVAFMSHLDNPILQGFFRGNEGRDGAKVINLVIVLYLFL